MKILAVITARGGSKRLPGKNIRPMGGRALINWSIDAAKNIPEICDILVSTDNAAIAAICEQNGALVPWLRPAELATDTATSIDVVLHALNWYEAEKGAVDGVLLLQPTSPFRTRKTIEQGIELFGEHRCRPVLAVSPTHAHPMWMLIKEGDYLRPLLDGDGFGKRSQDLPPVYEVNGSFYLISPADLREKGGFVSDKTIPLLIDSPHEALDIDTEWDWFVAECSLKYPVTNITHR